MSLSMIISSIVHERSIYLTSDEQELAELHTEYESRITELETEVERLQNEKRTLINDREER